MVQGLDVVAKPNQEVGLKLAADPSGEALPNIHEAGVGSSSKHGRQEVRLPEEVPPVDSDDQEVQKVVGFLRYLFGRQVSSFRVFLFFVDRLAQSPRQRYKQLLGHRDDHC